MTEKSVLLSGCGNIGFRHLQALCAMATPAAITVVEPNAGHHERIRGQFEASADSPHTFELHTEIPAEPAQIDLSVITTTAAVRRAVVEDVMEGHEVSAMILEKVLFQTVGDLDAVGALLTERGIAAFVNCGRRTFPGYEEICGAVAGPVEITVAGNNFGLASNAVHFLDLAEFVSGASIASIDVSRLEPGSQPSKRPGNVEIFGTLTATLDDGSWLAVNAANASPVEIEVVVKADDATYRINELARTVNDGTGSRPFISRNVSETTGIYEDVLVAGSCVLTPYADSARQHRYYLQALQSHLGLQTGADVVVPIS